MPADLLSGLPDHIQQGFLSGDMIRTMTKHWATEHCMDDDGKIALLDFSNVAIN